MTYLLVLIGSLCASGTLLAQETTVLLRVDPEQARVGDSVTVTVEASGELDALDPPKSPFQLQHSGQSTSMSIVNGRTTTRVTFHYSLLVRKAGVYEIGPAVARLKGKPVARSNKAKLSVRESPSLEPTNPEGQKLEDYEGKASFVLTQAAKGEVFVGEALRVNIDLYLRRGYPATGYDFVRNAAFEGFKKESLLTGRENRRGLQREIKIGRTDYIVMPLERVILIPLSAGPRVIGDLELKLQVQNGFRRSSKRVTAQPVTIQVQNMDAKSAPSGFVPGVVGRFKLSGGPDGTRAKVGDRLLLDLVVSGEGNIDAIEAPNIPAVDGLRLEAIPGRDCPQRDLTDKGYRGKCRFQTVLYPEKSGTILLGPVSFVYMDPTKRRYKTLKLGPWALKVAPSEHPVAQGSTVSDGYQADVRIEPPFIDRMPREEERASLPTPPSPWAALGGPVFLMFVLSFTGRLRQKRANDPQRAIRKIIGRALRELKSVSQSDEGQVSEVVKNSLRRSLIALIATDPQGIAKDGLRRQLEAHGIPSELSTDVLDIWEGAELLRYGGVSDAGALKERAIDLIEKLSRERL